MDNKRLLDNHFIRQRATSKLCLFIYNWHNYDANVPLEPYPLVFFLLANCPESLIIHVYIMLTREGVFVKIFVFN